METMNVVLAVDRDSETRRPTHFLVGVADRATRNWLSAPSRMAADFIARRIEAGVVFETFYAGEAGPWLRVEGPAGGAGTIVGDLNAVTGISLEDLPPCGTAECAAIYRGGRVL